MLYMICVAMSSLSALPGPTQISKHNEDNMMPSNMTPHDTWVWLTPAFRQVPQTATDTSRLLSVGSTPGAWGPHSPPHTAPCHDRRFKKRVSLGTDTMSSLENECIATSVLPIKQLSNTMTRELQAFRITVAHVWNLTERDLKEVKHHTPLLAIISLSTSLRSIDRSFTYFRMLGRAKIHQSTRLSRD